MSRHFLSSPEGEIDWIYGGRHFLPSFSNNLMIWGAIFSLSIEGWKQRFLSHRGWKRETFIHIERHWLHREMALRAYSSHDHTHDMGGGVDSLLSHVFTEKNANTVIVWLSSLSLVSCTRSSRPNAVERRWTKIIRTCKHRTTEWDFFRWSTSIVMIIFFGNEWEKNFGERKSRE